MSEGAALRREIELLTRQLELAESFLRELQDALAEERSAAVAAQAEAAQAQTAVEQVRAEADELARRLDGIEASLSFRAAQRAAGLAARTAPPQSLRRAALRSLGARGLVRPPAGEDAGRRAATSAPRACRGELPLPHGPTGLAPPVRPAPPGKVEPVQLGRASDPRLSILVPAHGHWEVTERCLRSLATNPAHLPSEVVLVDDASLDETPTRARAIDGLIVVRTPHQLGFVRACNLGLTRVRGELVLLLNNDTFVLPGALDALVERMDADCGIGAVGGKLVSPEVRLLEAGGIVFRDGFTDNFGRGSDPSDPRVSFPRDVDYCSAAALLVRRELLDQLGGLDERYTPAYYEDTDLCFALRSLGARVVFEPRAVVVHEEGRSNGVDPDEGVKRYQVHNRALFVEKWAAALAEQPPRDPLVQRRASRRRRRGRILVVDHRVPEDDRDSGSLRMHWILVLLSSLGFTVSFVAANGQRTQPYAARLEERGVEVVAGLGELLELVRSLGAELEVVVLSRQPVATQFLPLVRELAPGAAVVYDTVDLHWRRDQGQAALPGGDGAVRAGEVRQRLDLAVAASVEACLAVSEAEAAMLRAMPGVKEVHVLGNIHPLPSSVPGFAARSGLLFVGSFEHAPNLDGLSWFVADILPLIRRQRPDVTLTVVGNGAGADVWALGGDGVDVVGWVPEISEQLGRARVMVAPLRFGAGVKGKVTQSLAHGLPVVTTSVGAEGVGNGAADGLLVADDAASFAARVLSLYDDPDQWTRLSSAARQSAGTTTAPEAMRGRLEELLVALGCSRSARL